MLMNDLCAGLETGKGIVGELFDRYRNMRVAGLASRTVERDFNDDGLLLGLAHC